MRSGILGARCSPLHEGMKGLLPMVKALLGTSFDSPHPWAMLSSRLKSLTKRNSFWIHRVNCLGTEPHLASCQVQVAPARGKLRPACPGGMHAVVSCVPGPRFRPSRAKPARKESGSEVGSWAPQWGSRTPVYRNHWAVGERGAFLGRQKSLCPGKLREGAPYLF